MGPNCVLINDWLKTKEQGKLKSARLYFGGGREVSPANSGLLSRAQTSLVEILLRLGFKMSSYSRFLTASCFA